MFRNLSLIVSSALLGLCGATASAAIYTPTQTQLLTLVTALPNDGVASNTSSGSGVLLNLNLTAKTGFSQGDAKFSAAATPTNLSGFTSYDVVATRDATASNLNSARIYIKTGSGFVFKAGPTITLASATPTTLSFDLTTTLPTGSDLTNVKEIGLQFFGAAGSYSNKLVTLTPVPEPGSLLLAGAGGLMMLIRRRR